MIFDNLGISDCSKKSQKDEKLNTIKLVENQAVHGLLANFYHFEKFENR